MIEDNKDIKILFVYPNLVGQDCISMGIAIMSAYLKEKGYKTFLMDYTWSKSINKCIKKIKQIQPQIIAFSVKSGEYKFCVTLANKIKQNFDIPIIFGGVHPTVEPEEVIKEKSIDMICIGEGEETLAEILYKIKKGEDFSDTKNLWIKKEGKVIKNDLRPLIEDLNTLPFADREIFDYKKYLRANDGKIDVMAGRGCPYSCTYCVNRFNQKTFKGKYSRLRSPQRVIEEIKSLKRKYDIKSIAFYDEVLTANRVWLKEFSELYAQEIGLPFVCFARPETLNDETCDYLKKAGCNGIQIGVETGNEKIRREILNRHMSNEQIIQAFKCAKDHGIKTYAFNMVGIPFETEKDYWDTIKLNRIIKPDLLQATTWQPYPGTELHDLCIEKGFLKKDITYPRNSHYYSIVDYPDISKKQIRRWKQYFRYRVLKEYSYRKALLALFLDYTLIYWKLRPRLPLFMKNIIYKIKRKIKEAPVNNHLKK